MVNPEKIVNAVRDAGVVGCGGAGFPTHVKYNASVEYVIANAAECEPLLRIDQQLAALYPEKLVRGLELACIATGAKKGVIGIKRKYKKAISALEHVLRDRNKGPEITLSFLGNYYPAGDEHLLVYEVTGRVVPEGGIPLEVGVVVNNVNTLINVCDALEGKPVLDRPLTVTGAVAEPLSMFLPVGTSIKEALYLAGGPVVEPYCVLVGGPMMGNLTTDYSQPVTKTTGGLIVLSREHKLVLRKSQNNRTVKRIATEMCCSCRICTDMCPRHMLGHKLKPHKVMKAIYLGVPVKDHTPAFLCVECSLCEIACFMDLSPKRVFMDIKNNLYGKGLKNPHRRKDIKPHELREDRKTPVKTVMSKLALMELEKDAPLKNISYSPSRVSIPLKQHTGAPARPLVGPGDRVIRGQLIGEIPENSLGARIHASISGTVTEINGSIVIES